MSIFGKAWTFIEEARQELSRVNWPSRQETIRLTLVVVVLSFAVAFSLGIFDFAFIYGLHFLI
jgi:preprotein translocase subunit SecE